MSRTMYDALEASGIPHGAQLAAWYPYDTRSDGTPADATTVITIDNTGAHPDCMVLDVESGAATAADVPGWLAKCTQPYPTVYCDEATLPSVVAAVGTLGFYLWIAAWNGSPTTIYEPAYANVKTVAHQYESETDYDLSVVYDTLYSWYGFTLADPTAPAAPTPTTAVKRCTGLSGHSLHESLRKTGNTVAQVAKLTAEHADAENVATLLEYLGAGNWSSVTPVALSKVGANSPMPEGLVYYIEA